MVMVTPGGEVVLFLKDVHFIAGDVGMSPHEISAGPDVLLTRPFRLILDLALDNPHCVIDRLALSDQIDEVFMILSA
jgi:hypothetical protein